MDDINLHSEINLRRTLDASRHACLRDNDVICEFVCDRVPTVLPDWIRVEHQGIEDRFYCWIDWQHSQLECLFGQEFDPTDLLLALVQSLGFVNVDSIEWNARFEYES
ncbi:hypothetical protein LEP3755_62990 (plasmid) [Leptolyngbya sp. NIES-3755]|nr:hypothetical protein LEP3755_62990 [Leptolyngbya sp. NIES-3755]